MRIAAASFIDWLDMATARGMTAPRESYRRVLTQIAAGPAWAVREADNVPPLALGGIVHGQEASEVWLVAAPGASRRIASIALLARRALAVEIERTGRPVEARIHAANAAGRRLAAALGFRVRRAAGPIEIWRRGEPWAF